MQKLAEIGSERLVNVLVKDKNINPHKTLKILKSEITAVLESYLELDDEICIKVEEEKGRLSFKISATAIRIKNYGTII
ncbi:MAG: cell division topological specificity factor MinE [Clostridia bacterium]|nr:cell division topological specificity factor MinE [Clostridia bacterium]